MPVLLLRLGTELPWRELTGLVGLSEGAAPAAMMDEPSMHRGHSWLTSQREGGFAQRAESEQVACSARLSCNRNCAANLCPGVLEPGESSEIGSDRWGWFVGEILLVRYAQWRRPTAVTC